MTEKILLSAMHAAVSLSYVDSELARLETRRVLKDAAGWPHDPGDEERIRTLHAEVEAHERRFRDSPPPLPPPSVPHVIIQKGLGGGRLSRRMEQAKLFAAWYVDTHIHPWVPPK